MVDFIEISEYCINRYKETIASDNDSYTGTTFVAITSDDEVLCSTTPHILNKAKKCILIHSKSALAISNCYIWYSIEFIGTNGEVTNGLLGDGFKIYSNWEGVWSNRLLYLAYNDLTLYSCHAPFDDKMQKVWDVYLRAKKVKSQAELKLMAELIEKDEKILELEEKIANLKFDNILLEKQKKQYVGLLKDINELVYKKER